MVALRVRRELGAMVALRATRGKDKRPELDSDLMYVLLMPPSGKLLGWLLRVT